MWHVHPIEKAYFNRGVKIPVFENDFFLFLALQGMVGLSAKVCYRKCKRLVFLIFSFRIGAVKEDLGA